MKNGMKLEMDTKIIGTEKTVQDFWRWGFSNILTNNLRGILAEFIVGTALDNQADTRIEWDSYDLIYKGEKIEVKSAAYIQAWHNGNLSKISFSIGPKKEYNYETNKYSLEAKRHADVYVFCLLKEVNVDIVDPLDTKQWDFYIILTTELNQQFPLQKSISLSSIERMAQKCNYEELRKSIDHKLKK
ncbi:hypothetical protein BTR22_08955 [Alkalihalophilus pseudofirmus]|uniref:hypothetical protein n=1 Tax=Alkalihalophilus pseudofirmus TaxID=79885 RepID=UPI000952EA6B|nr:hypothetical protein BTR22_08955 [Alkalihalophilus pseudofirmus]